MQASIEQLGSDIFCRSPQTRPPELRLDAAAAGSLLQDWSARYAKAVRAADPGELLAIGRAIFDWLDANGWASGWAGGTGGRLLEIRVTDPGSTIGRALLDAPWELLADRNDHLAGDAVQLFELVRRIGPAAEPTKPIHSDLQVIFMAAAPEGQKILDFEAEESAILDATRHLPLHLVVEESGTADQLGVRLKLDGPFEALHLSCHGDIHPERGPVLALEDAVGDLAPMSPGDLVQCLGDPARTPLVFLSACRTAEQDDGARGFEPFVRELIRAGVPNVIGWDGSVYDTDAMAFAECLYGELAGRARTPRAVAKARLALRQTARDDPRRGSHWHLARLYLGPAGGGALAGKGLPKRRLASETCADQFLDGERGQVPVARRAEFVGRRRQIQSVLRAFRDGSAGVLVHGMGSLGKSSLAARIASRLTGHRTVVIFLGAPHLRSYDALTILDRLLEAVPVQQQQRQAARDTWRETVLADPGALAEALEDLLEGPLDAEPVLLVVDDLESILETPTPSEPLTPVQPSDRIPLAAVLTAFARASTASRLLLTSRYRFTLPDSRGRDLAETLDPVPLRPMDGLERRKQLGAAARTAKTAELSPGQQSLVERALDAAGGNPGLQATLTRPILNGEDAVAEQALAAIEHFRRVGTPPAEIQALLDAGTAGDADNALLAFFRRMAFATYRKALSPDQARMLRAAGVFSEDLPIPRPALHAAGAADGVGDPPAALDRLLALGLADDWGLSGGIDQAAANPLARPLEPPPPPELAASIAAAALPALDQAWRAADGDLPQDRRSWELTRLTLAAPELDTGLLCRAAEPAARWLFGTEQDARRAQAEVLRPSLERLDAYGAEPSHGLLLIAVDCAERLGDREAEGRALGMMRSIQAEGWDDAGTNLYVARQQQRLGDLDSALRSFESAAQGFLDSGREREWAIARGQIADILQARGNLDEALRIRTEEEIPVYERLGDVRAKAVTMGQIADILHARGNLDEALRIRTEEQLPVYERLGDVRGLLVCRTNIALALLVRRARTGDGKDAAEANDLLCRALADARRLRLPEAGQIEQILSQVGMACGD
ncbi:CHAT domain-containing protein [Thiobaca trueperi]|uniref:AAA ATPase-like protein n=1 Tax=Thiobaca trueperi TaxID=127458 RepID=A0A4R3N4X8_9GAMM|nr:CHAT domain-containing protein [Thiobaca trueperi]TCT24230.1 AAA ATPase-like protein [Thiobaca trueperi]